MPTKYNTIENQVITIYGCFQKFPLFASGVLPRCYPGPKRQDFEGLEWPKVGSLSG